MKRILQAAIVVLALLFGWVADIGENEVDAANC